MVLVETAAEGFELLLTTADCANSLVGSKRVKANERPVTAEEPSKKKRKEKEVVIGLAAQEVQNIIFKMN